MPSTAGINPHLCFHKAPTASLKSANTMIGNRDWSFNKLVALTQVYGDKVGRQGDARLSGMKFNYSLTTNTKANIVSN